MSLPHRTPRHRHDQSLARSLAPYNLLSRALSASPETYPDPKTDLRPSDFDHFLRLSLRLYDHPLGPTIVWGCGCGDAAVVRLSEFPKATLVARVQRVINTLKLDHPKPAPPSLKNASKRT